MAQKSQSLNRVGGGINNSFHNKSINLVNKNNLNPHKTMYNNNIKNEDSMAFMTEPSQTIYQSNNNYQNLNTNNGKS